MKKLKYLKLFEAFESNKLSKTLGYIKYGKNEFLSKLKSILDKIDFPQSKISDDYIEYLPFNKALKKSDIITDEPCDATSEGAFPEFAVEGAKCDKGKIERKWGSRTRKVPCPVCGGSGVKPKSPGDIKLLKFWFSQDGKFITTTAVDGIIRKNENLEISDNLSDYKVGNRIPKKNLKHGLLTLININGEDTICYIVKGRYDGFYALQNKHDGASPGYPLVSNIDPKDIAKYSWSLGGSDFSNIRLLHPKKEEDKKIDPYSWNVALSHTWDNRIVALTKIRKSVKEEIKDAHFALVLDIAKLSKSGFKTKSDIKSSREEIKKGAFLTDDEIKKQNIERYVDTISKSMDIVSDISNLNKVVNRLVQYKYALFSIMGGGRITIIESVIDNYYYLLSSENESEKKSAIESIERNIERISDRMKDKSLPNNIDILFNELKNNEKESHLNLLNRLMEISGNIYNKIKSYDIKTIEDLEVVYQKMTSIRSLFSSRRYKSQNLTYFFNSIINFPAYDKFTGTYYVNDEMAEKITKELDRIDKIISKI